MNTLSVPIHAFRYRFRRACRLSVLLVVPLLITAGCACDDDVGPETPWLGTDVLMNPYLEAESMSPVYHGPFISDSDYNWSVTWHGNTITGDLKGSIQLVSAYPNVIIPLASVLDTAKQLSAQRHTSQPDLGTAIVAILVTPNVAFEVLPMKVADFSKHASPDQRVNIEKLGLYLRDTKTCVFEGHMGDGTPLEIDITLTDAGRALLKDLPVSNGTTRPER